MARRLMLAITFVAIIATVCSERVNYFRNPSFEEGLKDWVTGNTNCVITNDTAHTGKSSLHCTSTSSASSYAAQWNYLFPGVRYNVSAYYKVKLLPSSSGRSMAYAEKDGYGVWSTIKCPNNTDPPCMSDWFYHSGVSSMFFKPENLSYSMGISSIGDAEFWVDDLNLEMVTTDTFLRAAEVRSWRQEVFEDKVEVLADILVSGTCFEDGTYLDFVLEAIDNVTGKVVDTFTNYTIQKRIENFLAVFIYDPTPLPEGFYNMRVTMTNSLFGITETVETYMHKLAKKRTYKRYIDNYNRVIDEDGKPFFPLGLYTSTICKNESEIKTITEGPFNLVLIPDYGEDNIDFIYNKSKRQLRVIYSLDCIKWCYTNQTLIDTAVECAQKRAAAWSKHEGLFGYYLFDEPGIPCIQAMRQVTLAIREIDYDHFIYPVIDLHPIIHNLKDTFDVFGVDSYPVQHIDNLISPSIVSRHGRDRVMNSRAMWNVPQIFDWSIYGRPNESPPTEKQLRHMTYQFIVGGGMGLMYFHYSEMQKMGWKNPVDKEWAKIKKVTKELNDKYVPIIMSGLDINPGLVLPAVNEYFMCFVRFFRYNGYDYALIVNGWDKREVTCTFWVTNTTKSIKKLTGDSEIKRDGNKISFVMKAVDVIWLKMKDPAWDDYHTYMNGTVVKMPSSANPVISSSYSSLLFIVLVFVLMFF